MHTCENKLDAENKSGEVERDGIEVCLGACVLERFHEVGRVRREYDACEEGDHCILLSGLYIKEEMGDEHASER